VEQPLHPLCEPLRGLLGTWSGRGHGEYPTIEPFDYREQITFAHVGKPFVSYVQRTQLESTGLPAHSESGYLRAVGDGAYELVISSPTGLIEIDRVEVTAGDALVLDVVATAVHRTPSAKMVTALTRRIVVEDDELRYDFEMAAMGHPLTHHLHAELRRAETPSGP
jgi:hypothetical protein